MRWVVPCGVGGVWASLYVVVVCVWADGVVGGLWAEVVVEVCDDVVVGTTVLDGEVFGDVCVWAAFVVGVVLWCADVFKVDGACGVGAGEFLVCTSYLRWC